VDRCPLHPSPTVGPEDRGLGRGLAADGQQSGVGGRGYAGAPALSSLTENLQFRFWGVFNKRATRRNLLATSGSKIGYRFNCAVIGAFSAPVKPY
jgi:hypothetical protein